MYHTCKRLIDILLSAILIVLLVPVFIIIGICVRCGSPGPVFYVHKRVGLNGKSIFIYKFRTMVPGADNLELYLNDEDLEKFTVEYKLEDDPRITGVGRFLRHTSLDELPQLLNILIGNMSFIGPRPVVQDELKHYTEDGQKLLLSVKPGLSGYWQVKGRGTASYESGDRQRLELYYARNASLMLDFKLFLMTFGTVLRGRGAM